MIDRVRETEGSLDSQAEMMKEVAMQFAASARERLADGSNTVREFVLREPAKAVGFALGLGVVLGWLIKRR